MYVCLQAATWRGRHYSAGELVRAPADHRPRGPDFAGFNDFGAEGLELLAVPFEGQADGSLVALYRDRAGRHYRLRGTRGMPFAHLQPIPAQALAGPEPARPAYDPIAATASHGFVGWADRTKPTRGPTAPPPTRDWDPLDLPDSRELLAEGYPASEPVQVPGAPLPTFDPAAALEPGEPAWPEMELPPEQAPPAAPSPLAADLISALMEPPKEPAE